MIQVWKCDHCSQINKDPDKILSPIFTDSYLIYQSQNDTYPELYDKKLFRTLSEKRDFKLNKLVEFGIGK